VPGADAQEPRRLAERYGESAGQRVIVEDGHASFEHLRTRAVTGSTRRVLSALAGRLEGLDATGQLAFPLGRGGLLAGEAFGAELFRKAEELLGLDALAGRGVGAASSSHRRCLAAALQGEAGLGAFAEDLAGALVEGAGAVGEVGEFAKFETVHTMHLLGVAGEHQERATATEGTDAGHHRTTRRLDRGRKYSAGNTSGCPPAEDLVPQDRFPEAGPAAGLTKPGQAIDREFRETYSSPSARTRA